MTLIGSCHLSKSPGNDRDLVTNNQATDNGDTRQILHMILELISQCHTTTNKHSESKYVDELRISISSIWTVHVVFESLTSPLVGQSNFLSTYLVIFMDTSSQHLAIISLSPLNIILYIAMNTLDIL